MNILLALFIAANAMRPGGDMRDVSMRPPSGGPAVTIDAMPFARTVTCSDYTLTGTAPGAGAVSWAASPSGASGACTGTTSWSCVVDVAPDAVGEGVEVITVTQGTLTDTETIGFYVDGEHSCFLAQSYDGAYNAGKADLAAVATWVNLGSSALNVTQATGTAQPTYRTGIVGGQPVVRCDGGDSLAASAAADWNFLNDGTDWTGESTVNVIGASGSIAPIFSTRLTSGNGVLFYVNSSTEKPVIQATLGSTAIFSLTGTSGSLNQYRMQNAIVDDSAGVGNDGFLFIDGDANGSAVAGAWPGTSSSPLLICVGKSGVSATSQFMLGDVARVLIYPSSLTSTQRGINLAVDEWALGGTLPVTP